jgi:hypothetical protein
MHYFSIREDKKSQRGQKISSERRRKNPREDKKWQRKIPERTKKPSEDKTNSRTRSERSRTRSSEKKKKKSLFSLKSFRTYPETF